MAGRPPFDRDALPAAIAGYICSAQRADVTKTHALGEHPVTLRERDGHQRDLLEICKRGGANEVRAEIVWQRAALGDSLDALRSRAAGLQTAGQALTPDEKCWLEEEAPQESRALEFRISALDELQATLGL